VKSTDFTVGIIADNGLENNLQWISLLRRRGGVQPLSTLIVKNFERTPHPLIHIDVVEIAVKETTPHSEIWSDIEQNQGRTL
jgi:hypothetical protein